MQANIVIGLFVAFYLISYIMTDVQDKKLSSFVLPAVIQTGIALGVLHVMGGGGAVAASVPSMASVSDVVGKFSAARF